VQPARATASGIRLRCAAGRTSGRERAAACGGGRRAASRAAGPAAGGGRPLASAPADAPGSPGFTRQLPAGRWRTRGAGRSGPWTNRPSFEGYFADTGPGDRARPRREPPLRDSAGISPDFAGTASPRSLTAATSPYGRWEHGVKRELPGRAMRYLGRLLRPVHALHQPRLADVLRLYLVGLVSGNASALRPESSCWPIGFRQRWRACLAAGLTTPCGVGYPGRVVGVPGGDEQHVG